MGTFGILWRYRTFYAKSFGLLFGQPIIKYLAKIITHLGGVIMFAFIVTHLPCYSNSFNSIINFEYNGV